MLFRAPARFGLDPPGRVGHNLVEGFVSELLFGLAPVRFDRLLAETEPVGDPFGGQSLSHQSENLQLPVGKLIDRKADLLDVSVLRLLNYQGSHLRT